jgi:hypothetical protein
MNDDEWFAQAISRAEVNTMHPRIFASVEAEEQYHHRIHGIADGFRWCVQCQRFMGTEDAPNEHPHVLAGLNHREDCVLCITFEVFRYGLYSHLEQHTSALGWYSCSVCPGQYSPDVDEDDHDHHPWGLFEAKCDVCQGWVRMAEILLDTLSSASVSK